jgi:GST-like protein
MLELYTGPVPNGRRATIIIEECGLPYRLHNLNLPGREQKEPPFLALNPLGNVPVLVDPEGPDGKPVTVTQSAAIAIYLAEKTGKFLPQDPARRLVVIQYLFMVMSDVAATSTSMFLATHKDPQSPLAAIFDARMRELLLVISARLDAQPYLADALSIADFALLPLTLLPHVKRVMADLPSQAILRWAEPLLARETVQRALAASPAFH